MLAYTNSKCKHFFSVLFLECYNEYKDGAINAESIAICYDKCGNLKCDIDLTMYVTNDKIARRWWFGAFGFEGSDYISRTDLDEYFVEYAKYPHKCDKCGETIRVLKEDDEIVCPECKLPLENTDIIMWD